MKSVQLAVCMLPLLMMVGCAEYEGDPRFGEAVRNNIALQSVTPPAQVSVAPIALDGATTKATMDNYIYSYLHPQSLASSLAVGMGASAAGAGPTAAPVTTPTGSY
ncbi:hypothetical protein [Ferrovum myxofaciens]|uniref:Pilus assembly protein n=1 Tax=Ferrovum myxofaciens TaxID=416213 RepID=A0A8F3DXG9_9PROT|nr:hypothetical protein [Ferrovum myxofaciens]MBW8028639.1 hypothetical protein [Ferrovum sp.]KXW57811.1 hypothetical protein FEMY_16640 [Ferrovum myxofaciens]NDU90596.1 hypothetical protein [Ferrovum sp.]QKE39285.1 MAG: hypothetical protein HO273_11625 [Ferrovum myxofaciens]QWY74546.1 MAG: hypothetical protein JVY19_12195 [Ferrovum myxofaciens]